jgi:hypothetical protein
MNAKLGPSQLLSIIQTARACLDFNRKLFSSLTIRQTKVVHYVLLTQIGFRNTSSCGWLTSDRESISLKVGSATKRQAQGAAKPFPQQGWRNAAPGLGRCRTRLRSDGWVEPTRCCTGGSPDHARSSVLNLSRDIYPSSKPGSDLGYAAASRFHFLHCRPLRIQLRTIYMIP